MQKPAITRGHLGFLFETIKDALEKTKPRAYPPELPNFECPLFVTWYKGKKKAVRGCIGTFQPEFLSINLAKFAKISAFEDHRFGPILLNELPDLTVGLSLLINFQKRTSWDDWVVGQHGTRIEFRVKGRHYGATYLPEVPKEQGWDRRKTLEELVTKSGYKGTLEEVLPLIEMETYESVKEMMTYAEFEKEFMQQK